MRPRGEVRDALARAVERLNGVQGAVTSRQAAEAACVGYDVARSTMKNMVAAGELLRVGKEHRPGWERWQTLYEVAPSQPAHPWGGDSRALVTVMRVFPARID